jgi:uridine kinase
MAFDFASGLRSDGTCGLQDRPVERRPTEVVLLDGVYSACPILSDLMDLTVLVDVPVETRRQQLAAREESVFLEKWHERWDAVERYYFTQVRPRSSFDLVVALVS